MTQFHEFKPSPKGSSLGFLLGCVSPTLSESTASPAWSPRSAEAMSSGESGESTVQRGRLSLTKLRGADSGSDSSDAESFVPRSRRSFSLDMTPRKIEDDAGQEQMPVTFPAPDAVPWAGERVYLDMTRRHVAFPDNAFKATLGFNQVEDQVEDQVPGTTLSLSAALCSPSLDSKNCVTASTFVLPVSADSINFRTAREGSPSPPDCAEDRARMHAENARGMMEASTEELKSIADEMEELSKDLFKLRENVAAARPMLSPR